MAFVGAIEANSPDSISQIVGDLRDTLKNREDAGRSELSLLPDQPILSQGGLDSLQFVDFITAIEERWKIEFSEEELSLETMETLNKIAALIQNKVG